MRMLYCDGVNPDSGNVMNKAHAQVFVVQDNERGWKEKGEKREK